MHLIIHYNKHTKVHTPRRHDNCFIMATLPSFPQFDVKDQSNLAVRWEKLYLKRFKNLMTAMAITDASRQRALLLHYSYVGEDVNDIFETSPDHGDEKDFKEACEALTQYFTPRENVSFEVFKFRNMTQHDGETIDEFHTRLQMGAKYCELGENQQREIKSQIELGTSNKKLRGYSFRNPSISLDDLLAYARTFDETERQARGIEGAKGETSAQYEVRKIDFRQKQLPVTQRSKERRNPRQQNSKVNVPKICFLCGDNWPHPNNFCPAMNQKCKRCLKMNHFARVGRSGEGIQPIRSSKVFITLTLNPRQINHQLRVTLTQNLIFLLLATLTTRRAPNNRARTR